MCVTAKCCLVLSTFVGLQFALIVEIHPTPCSMYISGFHREFLKGNQRANALAHVPLGHEEAICHRFLFMKIAKTAINMFGNIPLAILKTTKHSFFTRRICRRVLIVGERSPNGCVAN